MLKFSTIKFNISILEFAVYKLIKVNTNSCVSYIISPYQFKMVFYVFFEISFFLFEFYILPEEKVQ